MSKQKKLPFNIEPEMVNGRRKLTPAERAVLLDSGPLRANSNTFGGRLQAYAPGWLESFRKADHESQRDFWNRRREVFRERARKQGGKKWTFDKVHQLAMTCRDQHEFRAKHRNAYAAMVRNQWNSLVSFNRGGTNG